MFVGTADPKTRASGAAKLTHFDVEPVVLPDVEVFQALFEMRIQAREALLPPGLHPTNPATLVLLAWRCPESPWGPFALCQLRVGCRSGVRSRGLVLGCACDSEQAALALAAGWGFAARPAEISLQRRYDGLTLRVSLEGRQALGIEALDPDPLSAGDAQYTGTLTLAETPRGLRLVQVEPVYASSRVERLRPRLTHFDAALWGQPLMSPYHPVSASVALAEVTLPPVRFVCLPDVLAFEGTERVSTA
jgi:hypothetical protein